LLARTFGLATEPATRITATFVAAVFGLIIGSFLNVVVYRAPRGLSVVQPGSFCPACGTPIRSSDNIPVISWLALRAKCRHCGEPISPRYPAVELLTGALFAAVAWSLGAHWAVPGMCALGATALALAAIELDGMVPPASLALIGTGVGAALLLAASIADRRWWHLGGMLIGIAVAGCAAVIAVRRSRRHGSDATMWALVPAGAVAGWVGAPGTVVGVATFVVTVVPVAMLIRGRARHGDPEHDGGVAVAAAVGAAAALIGAFVAGSPIGL
jgi:leader peptidase (prepilin peptidase)/N-methyltransferase